MFVSWTQTVAIFEAELENLVRLEPNRPNRSTVKLGAEWVKCLSFCLSLLLLFFLECDVTAMLSGPDCLRRNSIILEVSILCWTRTGSGFFVYLRYLGSIP